jgi:hypothetical protein
MSKIFVVVYFRRYLLITIYNKLAGILMWWLKLVQIIYDILIFMNLIIVLSWLIDFLVFNATFSNISAVSWRQVLVVEEAGKW